MKKKEIVMSVIFLIYVILGCSYVFFSDYTLNKILSIKFGFAQLYSFITMMCLTMIAFSVLLIVIILFKNGFKLKGDIVNVILLLTIVFSILFIVFEIDTGKMVEVNKESKTIKLVEWNVADNINETDIQEIFGKFDADIAVFPELGGYYKRDVSTRRLLDLFKKANVDFENYQVYISKLTEGRIAPVTIVIKKTFGSYGIDNQAPMTRFGTVYLSPISKGNPPIIGLHTAPPLPGLMSMWRRDLNLITDISNNYRDAIIIGDFNATMKHGNLNNIKSHIDILGYAGQFNSGTWSTSIPSIFRSRIDHILIPKDKYNVRSIEIKKYNNSDHSCVFSEIEELEN